MKRIKNLENLKIGNTYYVICGIWQGKTIYCGNVHSIKEYTFTFGNCVDDWKNSFNIVARKSKLKVYEF